MWLWVEIAVVIACFAIGCRRRSTAELFLSIVAVFLAAFALFKGNPIGLLVSSGGWLILDAMLMSAVAVSSVFGRSKSRLF